MRGGVRRLLLMVAAPTPPKVRRGLDQRTLLSLAGSDVDVDDLVDDCIAAAVDAVMARSELPWDDRAFGRLEQTVRDEVPQLAVDAAATAADVVAAADRVRRRTRSLTADVLGPTVADAEAHVDRLVAPGFVRRCGTDRLPDVHRYVRGIEYRLDHLGGDVARDQRRMAEVRPVERELAAVADRPNVDADRARELAWMVEELRMSVFAQPLGVHGPVSPKRIRRAIADLERDGARGDR
jgi:ATP-dependent helicase HrpA